MKKLFMILNYFLLLFSCKKIDDNGYRVFKIKKGTHRSTLSYKTTKLNKFKLNCILRLFYLTRYPLCHFL